VAKHRTVIAFYRWISNVSEVTKLQLASLRQHTNAARDVDVDFALRAFAQLL